MNNISIPVYNTDINIIEDGRMLRYMLYLPSKIV